MNEKSPDGQQILWTMSASSPTFPLESWVLELENGLNLRKLCFYGLDKLEHGGE